MGIQGLSKVIADHAPRAIQEHPITNYFGRKIAIDASTSIYQFLVAVRAADNANGGIAQNLQNASGETTSHIMGMFYRTIRMLENGIKPVYVFDGKPPDAKYKELAKRSQRRQEAVDQSEAAKEAGDMAMVDKMNRRNVKVTPKHNDDCKQLLTLMGVPWIQAPGEAEAQCASLVRSGEVYAAGSEDMDTLTFGATVLLRHLTFSEAKKMPITEFHLDKVLEGLHLNMTQFIDLCILLGCDYCDGIRGIGPMRAVSLIQQHGSIEAIIDSIDKDKYSIPEDWPYQHVRQLFENPDVVIELVEPLKWNMPDTEALVDYMVKQNGFSEVRVRAAISKIVKARKTAPQGRLDTFFKKVEGSTDLNSNEKPQVLSKKQASTKKQPKTLSKKAKTCC